MRIFRILKIAHAPFPGKPSKMRLKILELKGHSYKPSGDALVLIRFKWDHTRTR